jgi:dUTP pyrophosphatase
MVLFNMATTSYPTFVMFLDSEDNELKEWYKERIQQHNASIRTDLYPNSGFDLATPNDITVPATVSSTKLITLVKGKMVRPESNICMGYYMYPRSSISKIPLILSNHVGIIDSGYRGSLTGMFRNLESFEYTIKKYDRLLQVCTGTLEPFLVEMVDSEQELGKTSRGSGGFGSTGK